MLHVNDHPPGHQQGGAEVNLMRLIAAQRAAGDDVETLTGDLSHTGVRRALDLWDPGARRRLVGAVSRFDPDVVHLHNVVRELSPSVLRPTGTPTVMTVHDMRFLGGGEHRLPDPRAAATRLWIDPLVRRLSRSLAAVLGVSDVVADALRAAGLQRVWTLLVPVPDPIAAPRPVEECHDVVFAGSLVADKGARVLMEAFHIVAARHPAARLVLIGDGPERRRLLDEAGDRVVLPGRLDGGGVSSAMGKARVVVVPSLPALRREGSSITAAEGARHGRPLVVSDDPAVAEVARRVGGDVVPAGDVGALAARLDHWLGAPAAARAAGARASASAAANFAPTVVATRLKEIYSDCLART